MPGRPLRIQPLEMQLKRTLPDAEDIRALTTQNLADNAAAMPGTAHDLLDRGPFLSQPKNRGVGLFPAHVPFILNPLGSGEQIGIDRRGADRAPDLPHGFAHRIQESAAGILHQVPAVGDLDGLRQRLCRRRGISCEAHSMVRSGCGFWYDSFSPLAAAQFFLPRS